MTRRLLNFVLCLTGLALFAIALNTALGGMATLGWQFPTDVLTITDAENFARHDSNARFFAGTFAGLGLLLIASAFAPKLRLVAAAILIAIALGGLFRLLQRGYSPLGDAALMPSLIFELFVFPLLALWVMRAEP